MNCLLSFHKRLFTVAPWTRRVLHLPWARSAECRNSTQNIHLLLQTLFVTEIYVVMLFACHLPFYQNDYWEFKGGGAYFLFLVTKLATYGSNLCHSTNVGNGLLAVGWCGVKRSTDKRDSNVHASPSFICLSVAKTPTIDEAMNVPPIG
jgi:hypothetical protein